MGNCASVKLYIIVNDYQKNIKIIVQYYGKEM